MSAVDIHVSRTGRIRSESTERNMPRLLPRLLKALQETSSTSTHVPRSQNVRVGKRKSLYRPMPVSLPSFHPAGRTRSILLDENPVTDKRVFTRHKRLPPRVRLGLRLAMHEEHDVPREMTTQEREWWSSPYCAFDRSFPRLPIRPTNDSENVGYPVATMRAFQKVSTQRYVFIYSCTSASHHFHVQISSSDSRCYAYPQRRMFTRSKSSCPMDSNIRHTSGGKHASPCTYLAGGRPLKL